MINISPEQLLERVQRTEQRLRILVKKLRSKVRFVYVDSYYGSELDTRLAEATRDLYDGLAQEIEDALDVPDAEIDAYLAPAFCAACSEEHPDGRCPYTS